MNPNINPSPNYGYTNYADPSSFAHLAAAPSYPRTQPQPVASSSNSAVVPKAEDADRDKFFDELSYSEDESGSGDDYDPQEDKGKSVGGQFDQGLIRGALKPSRSVQVSKISCCLNWRRSQLMLMFGIWVHISIPALISTVCSLHVISACYQSLLTPCLSPALPSFHRSTLLRTPRFATRSPT